MAQYGNLEVLTVKELIEKLNDYDPNAIVGYTETYYGFNPAVSVGLVIENGYEHVSIYGVC